tara:strand:- start:776 stop:928 length:153 start_codon:yes stop_codon:yes gene_type:complete
MKQSRLAESIRIVTICQVSTVVELAPVVTESIFFDPVFFHVVMRFEMLSL